MIHHEIASSVLRFYPLESKGPPEEYTASCTLVWQNPTTVFIKGLHGTLNRDSLKDLIVFCRGAGIKEIRATRSYDHKVPFGIFNEREGYYYVDVDSVYNYIQRRYKHEG